jgi:hypothetical protein
MPAPGKRNSALQTGGKTGFGWGGSLRGIHGSPEFILRIVLVVLQDGERRELSKYPLTISNAKKSAKLLMESEDFFIFFCGTV